MPKPKLLLREERLLFLLKLPLEHLELQESLCTNPKIKLKRLSQFHL